jgi:hypothetical protein
MRGTAVTEDLACSDLCEENGFHRPAELLRSISGRGRKVYVVVERGAEYNDEIYSPREKGEPRTIFLEREAAERAAADRDADWHRYNNILDFCYQLKQVTDLSAAELSARIGTILDREYRLPNEGYPTYASAEGPLIPDPPPTDEQMRAIAALFTLKFFYVEETEFAAADGAPGRPAES